MTVFSLHSEQKVVNMTDFWVSQGRKYCEFCKCFISDNKPSIQFHENGKKHKENVSKRLSEMQKKAKKEAKDAVKFDKELKKMEDAAVRAYMKDVEFNPDYTSRFVDTSSYRPEPEKPAPAKPVKKEPPREKPKIEKKWMEAAAEDGTSYYWNTETGESKWEEPEEGFMSIAEQERSELKRNPHKKPKPFKKKNKKWLEKGGVPSASEGKSQEIEKKEEKAEIEFGPLPKGHPYGSWEKVEIRSEPMDLQLPRRSEDYVAIPVSVKQEESFRKFKEKKITAPGTLDSLQGETSFKKRKFNSNPNKNMRQRTSDE